MILKERINRLDDNNIKFLSKKLTIESLGKFEREYLKEKKEYRLLTEASLTRLKSIIEEKQFNSWAIISAYDIFEYYNSLEDFKCRSNSQNRQALQELKSDLLSMGYKGFSVLGGRWRLEDTDNDKAQATQQCIQGNQGYVDEESLFIPNILLSDAEVLSKKYAQEAIIYYGEEVDNEILLYFIDDPKSNFALHDFKPISMEKYYKANMQGAPSFYSRIGGKAPSVQSYEENPKQQGVGSYFKLEYVELTSEKPTLKSKTYYNHFKKAYKDAYDIMVEILKLDDIELKRLQESL